MKSTIILNFQQTWSKMKKTIEKLPSWDLSDLYPSNNSTRIKQDLKKARDLSEKFKKKFEGKLADLKAENLASAIMEYEKIEEICGKLSSFAYLFYAENIEDEERSRFWQDISEKITEISTIILFFTLELNELEERDIKKKISNSKQLAYYDPWLKSVRAFKPYQLSADMEKILHEKDVSGRQAWNRLYDETLAGLRFPYGKKQLTISEILDLFSSTKEQERKNAGLALGKVLGENSKIFAMVTNTLAKDKAVDDKWRGFSRPISSRNVSNYIEDNVVDALISSVKKSYPQISHRYYKIKAKWLGKKKLDYWDRNAPLPEEKEKYIKWDDAVEIVLSSYNSFSPKLADLGKKFFDNNWIDVPPRNGKDSGAFAHPTVVSAHPYLLLNYHGKVRDVMTLAHELGHGVHQLLAAKQGQLMADTPLTLAETASVFGEQLTFQEMLAREKNKKKKKSIIAGKVEDMINTVVRQIAFCEFERIIHDERKKGEISTQRICEIWMQVQSESLGSSVKLSGDYKYFWSYIPHFIHSPFYVYSYAFGDCLVNALYANYLEEKQGFEKKYFTMLEAGGTLQHKELLAPFGLDASKPEFWQKGLNIISGYIDQLEEL